MDTGSHCCAPSGTVVWPADAVVAHPGNEHLAVIGWRSPVKGRISIAGLVRDQDPVCGDGIAWSIERGRRQLAAGAIENGGEQLFRDAPTGLRLTRLHVKPGDFIYVVIHPREGYACDSTRIDLTITLTSRERR